jgi:hypothetical protein
VARAQGYAVIVHPDAPLVEMDTFTCCHCNGIVAMHDVTGARVDPGGFCRMCFRQTCGPCADQGSCVPFEAKLEQMEARQRLLDAVGV